MKHCSAPFFTFNLLFLCIVFNLLDTQAQTNTYYIKDLGIVDTYTICLQENEIAFLSHDGSPAYQVYNGEVITEDGSYHLTLKTSNRLIRFTIDNLIKIQTINNEQDLYKAIEYALKDGNDFYEFGINKNFKYNQVFKDKVASIHQKLQNYFPFIDFQSYELLIYEDKIQFYYTRRMDQQTYNELTPKMRTKLNRFIDTLDMSASEIELEKQIVDYINSHYIYDNRRNDVPAHAITRTLQGAYAHNELVCSSYAKMAMYLLNSVGIPTQYVTGHIKSNGGAHAWNIVKLNQEFYHLDLTWSDVSYCNKNYYNYVNETDAYMALTHEWNRDIYPKCQNETYKNLNIYDFYTLTDQNIAFYTNLDQPILFKTTDDILIKKQLKKLASYLSKPIVYHKFQKENKTIVLIKNP